MEKVYLNLESFNGITFRTKDIGDQKNQCVLELDEEIAHDILFELTLKLPAQAYRWGKRVIKDKNNDS